MPSVIRDKDKQIIAVYKKQTRDATEYLSYDNSEIIAFLENSSPSEAELRRQLTASDVEMIRAIEDLIDALLLKEVITITDISPYVLEKISRRKGIRDKMKALGGLILDDQEKL